MERRVRRREEIGRTLGRKRREMLARGEKAIGRRRNKKTHNWQVERKEGQ